MRLITGLFVLLLLPAPAPAPAGGALPAPRHHHAMVYDVARSRLVVFGGNVEQEEGLAWSAETWELAAGGWNRAQVSGPPGLSSHALVYHEGRGRALLLGGVGEDRQLSAGCWTWDGKGWESVAGGPSARHSPVAGYDPKRQRVVVFGGSGRGSDPMWEWDGEAWHAVPLSEPHPPVVMRAGFAFDAVRQEMLLFGGYLGGVHGDTWSWNGVRWKRLEVAGPPARANLAMATDPARKRIVLFGGSDAARELYADTWEWDGRQWHQVGNEVAGAPPERPPARTVAGMAFDSGLERIVMYGGRGANRRAYGDLWAWDGKRWRRLEGVDAGGAVTRERP